MVKIKNWSKLLISVLSCEIVGLASTPVTITAINEWYITLTKPVFAPPNWLFGPVWTLLYLLMGVSFYLIWIKGLSKPKVLVATRFFGAQLAANFLWSWLFFGLRSPIWGLIDILVMVVLIVMTMRKFYPLSRGAAWLLVPYLAWVSFATLLNLGIVLLNH